MSVERWSDRGEMPELERERVSAPKSPRPWTVEDVARLKVCVPFHPNGWNTCAKILDDWKFSLPWATLFIFSLSLLSPQMQDMLGIDLNTASTVSLVLLVVWVTPVGLLTIAEKNKIRPPRWASRSLGDFYTSRGDIAAMPEFQALLATLLEHVPHGVPAWSPYEIEWCQGASIIIVWRLCYKRVTIGVYPTATTRLEYEDKVPMAVFDAGSKEIIDPSKI